MAGHFIETCCCGNVLAQCRCFHADKMKIRRSPCRCEEPGPGPTTVSREDPLPTGITENHYNERKRTGIPMVTPIERTQFYDKKWI